MALTAQLRVMAMVVATFLSISTVIGQSTSNKLSDECVTNGDESLDQRALLPVLEELVVAMKDMRRDVVQLQEQHDIMLGRLSGRILLQQHNGGTSFFNRTWNEFKVGFGDVTGNYWIGNDRLHHLTKYGQYKLRVGLQLKSNKQWYWAEYSTFRVDDELNGYRLSISGHSGTAGDSLTYVNGTKFSTRDRDNDVTSTHCASEVSQGNGGGFWYRNCNYAFLNSPIDGRWGFVWYHLPIGYSDSNKLQVSRMTLIPIN